MKGIGAMLRQAINQVIKREKEVASLCAKYNISKEQAETIQEEHHKLSATLISPPSLDQFASQIMSFESWCDEMNNMNRNKERYE